MKKILLALVAATALAQDKKPVDELLKQKLLRIQAESETLELKKQLLEVERIAALTEICKGAGADLKECSIDPQTWTAWRVDTKIQDKQQ